MIFACNNCLRRDTKFNRSDPFHNDYYYTCYRLCFQYAYDEKVTIAWQTVHVSIEWISE